MKQDSLKALQTSARLSVSFGLKVRHMKTAYEEYNQIVASIPKHIDKEVEMELAISTRIYDLMTQRGLSKAEFARAVGKRPCEITKWLSGQHNFTIATLGMLSAFFGQPIITVG